MQIVILIITIIIFIKTLKYGIYEYKSKNISGGISIIIIALLSFILPNLAILIRGQ